VTFAVVWSCSKKSSPPPIAAASVTNEPLAGSTTCFPPSAATNVSPSMYGTRGALPLSRPAI
jgi:hypothetical protein